MTRTASRGGGSPGDGVIRWAGWLLAVVCLAGIPLAMVWLGLAKIADSIGQRTRTAVAAVAAQRLEVLQHYVSEPFFVTALLNRVVRQAEAASRPEEYLRRVLPRVARLFGGACAFKVWDASGTPVMGFSGQEARDPAWDGTRHALAILSQLPEDQPLGTAVESRLPLLRRTLGNLVGKKNIRRPGLGGPLLLVSEMSPTWRYAWYEVGRRVGLLCLIQRQGLSDLRLLRTWLAVHNRRSGSTLKLGLFRAPDFSRFFPAIPGIPAHELMQGLARFRTETPPILETPSCLAVFRAVDRGVWLFAVVRKDPLLAGGKRFRQVCLLLLVGLFLLAGAVTWPVMVGQGEVFLPIRWKVGAAFLLAGGVPLSVLGFLGSEFLFQKKVTLTQEARAQALQVLEQIDSSLPSAYGAIERRLQGLSRHISRLDAEGRLIRPRVLTALRNALWKAGSHSFQMVASNGVVILTPKFLCTEGFDLPTLEAKGVISAEDVQENQFLALFAKWGMRKLNRAPPPPKEEADRSIGLMETMLDRPFEELVNEGMQTMGTMQTFGIGDSPEMGCWNTVVHPRTGGHDYLLLVRWRLRTMGRLYLTALIDRGRMHPPGMTLFAFQDGHWRIPAGEGFPNGLWPFLGRTLEGKEPTFGRARRNGESCLILGYPGKELKKGWLFALVPLGGIHKAVEGYRWRLNLFGFLTLIMAVAIGQIVSRRFLEPTGSLTEVALAIGERRFEIRLTPGEPDEFGTLARTFNQVLEGLSELSLARVVQENLFPKATAAFGDFGIVGRCLPMRELGGDYFDVLSLESGRFGLLTGDVAGHGVSAALGMAMAKGAVCNNPGMWNSPAALLHRVNQDIMVWEGKKQRRMMTCLYLAGDPATGEMAIANAGQSYPVHFRSATGEARLVEVPGNPLGVSTHPRIGETSVSLAPGDCLVLYTDGLVEVRGREGGEWGYDSLVRRIAAAGRHDPATLLEILLAAHLAHRGTAPAQDDVTIVVLARAGVPSSLEVTPRQTGNRKGGSPG